MTLITSLTQVGTQIVSSLTPQLLVLILLNLVFIALLFWFISARAEHTAVVMQQLLDSCLQRSK